MCPVGQTLSGEEEKPSCSCLCTATAWNDVLNRNGLGGHVLVPDSDLESEFYDNSSSDAWKKRVE